MRAEHESQFEETDLRCAVCGNERIVVESDGTVTCPDCRESYAIVRHEEFTLIETDGWAVGVTVDAADGTARTER